MNSKCHTCARFWKTCAGKEKRCYKGGTDGGLVRMCAGYEKAEGAAKEIRTSWFDKAKAEYGEAWKQLADRLLRGIE